MVKWQLVQIKETAKQVLKMLDRLEACEVKIKDTLEDYKADIKTLESNRVAMKKKLRADRVEVKKLEAYEVEIRTLKAFLWEYGAKWSPKYREFRYLSFLPEKRRQK